VEAEDLAAGLGDMVVGQDAGRLADRDLGMLDRLWGGRLPGG
jgi:hypothetical protein